MRCPKCGAFAEEGRTVCFMCGENLVGGQNQGFDVQNNQPVQSVSNNIIDSTLNDSFNASLGNVVQSNNTHAGFQSMEHLSQSSDNSFGTGSFSGGFSNGSVQSPVNNMFNQQKDNSNGYKDIKLNSIKSDDKDIFDFFSENKTIIKIVSLVLLIALLGFIGYNVYKSKTKPVEIKPVLQNLYYEVSDEFREVENGGDRRSYSKSGSTGADCYIEISVNAEKSGNHVEDFQQAMITELTPERDEMGEAVDPLMEFTTQKDSITLNDHTWHYMNFFYRKNVSSQYTLLRYQLLGSSYDGRNYDIILTNNSSSNACGTSLDDFMKSLKFVDTK